MMPVYLLNEGYNFPPVELSNRDGLLAVGGDLNPKRILNAYSNGIFPWYSEGQPIMWWSPNPRMVLFPDQFKISKSLRQIIRNDRFTVSFDGCFEDVIQACRSVRRKEQEGTWITRELLHALIALNKMGYAHSVETFREGKLVGGLYGISLGGVFFGESMFHFESSASKVALYHLVEFLKKHNFDLIDAQQQTEHLSSLGAIAINRKEFLLRIAKSMEKQTIRGDWGVMV